MSFNKDIIEKLTALREKKKFTHPDWTKRGLNPSAPDVINGMVRLTDACLDELLAGIKTQGTERQIRETLIKGLKRFNSEEYDTEEKEFIGDEFHNIGSILGLDISNDLVEWSYGKEFAATIRQIKKEEVIVEKKSFECTKCKLSLNLMITAVRDGAANHWIIARCNQCGEYNLLSTGDNAAGLKFENFTSGEVLNSNKNSEDQVKARLEHLKKFGR